MLVLVSFFLLFSIPLISLIYLSATQGAQDSAVLQARQAGREIVGKADSVYSEGKGTSEEIVVVFPPNLQEIAMKGRELTFSVQISSGRSDVVSMGTAEIKRSGKIGLDAGPHRLTIRSLGNYVEISEG